LLVTGHEAVARPPRAAVTPAPKAGDATTCEVLTQRRQVHEKTARMLRSLLK
jgi:starvation-inducible DNA-binding protein